MFTDHQTEMLKAKLDAAHVKTRSQAGRSLSYIEAWQATAEANTVFGFSGWDSETLDLRVVAEGPREIGQRREPGFGVSYTCRVRVTVRAGGEIVTRDGIGAGHGIDRDLGQAHESAAKEAESDALKRALKSFGWRFGLALYDKDKEHVETHRANGRANGPGATPAAPLEAGGVTSPMPPAPRQRSRSAVNPETGHRIDPDSAAQFRKTQWLPFEDRVQGFEDGRDLEGLKAWFASYGVNKRIASWGEEWRDAAQQRFELACQKIEERERA